MMKKKILIGCIADDFTGAGDAASFIASKGLNTILLNGVESDYLTDMEQYPDAVVIALKIRSIPPEEAAAESEKAYRWLVRMGAEHIYYKYCSTFDSTPKGNIGPVADNLMECMDVPFTVLCPALPVNGRTVENGTIYVNGVKLSDSPMKNHPLNPMTKSSIPELMSPQSKYPCVVLRGGDSSDTQRRMIKEASEAYEHFYVVPDYADDEEGKKVAEAFADLKLITGGSGLLEHLAGIYKKDIQERGFSFEEPEAERKTVILSGSCSEATEMQINEYKTEGQEIVELNLKRLIDEPGYLLEQWNKLNGHNKVLIKSSAKSDRIEPEFNGRNIPEVFEKAFSELSIYAKKDGYKGIIVAGGETSGAVIKALGYHSFWIGKSIAPGVPILIPVEEPEMRLVLKSGNFGGSGFFSNAIRMIE
ncbi:MAG: four-carbon acid sugar kinase family protein [Parasporobacterium sp.]|nr:four-carbon acid sugar kinase family protein [Parasporobacterium sp.]